MEKGPGVNVQATPEQLPKQFPSTAGSPVDETVRHKDRYNSLVPIWGASFGAQGRFATLELQLRFSLEKYSSPYCRNFIFFSFQNA